MPRIDTTTHAIRAEEGAPAVRAKAAQQWLLLAERRDPVSAARLQRVLDEGTRRSIVDAAPLSWVPIELDIRIVEAVAEVLGPQRFGAFARSFFLDIMPRQPLGALLELGTKLMGRSPESFLRWWDKGWDAVYRNLGTVRGHVDSSTSGRVVYENMPAICLRSEPFVEAMLGSAYGIYSLTDTTGVVRISALRPLEGRVELQFEWRRRRSQRGSIPS